MRKGLRAIKSFTETEDLMRQMDVFQQFFFFKTSRFTTKGNDIYFR